VKSLQCTNNSSTEIGKNKTVFFRICQNDIPDIGMGGASGVLAEGLRSSNELLRLRCLHKTIPTAVQRNNTNMIAPESKNMSQ